MAPVSNPLKVPANPSDEDERGQAKKSRMDDDNISIEVKSETASLKAENDYSDDEPTFEDDSADTTSREHYSVGNSVKRNHVSSLKQKKYILHKEKETDPVILTRREKQIEYGKNTTEYYNYLEAVPKASREKFHPKTPNMHRKYSRRAWDGLIRQWRLNLHCWSSVPLEELGDGVALEQLRRNDSFCSMDSSSTSSSVAAAFGAGLGIVSSSSKEDIKSVSRGGSFPDDEENDEDVDEKPDFKSLDIKIEPVSNLKLETLENSEPEEKANLRATMKFENVFIKNRKLQVKLEPGSPNASWADEVEEFLADEVNNK